ncbi:pyridoxal 5'-phosphate synthase [Streptomyces sp. MZ04]|uniref:pyridoxine/pyridoxamine 5'-phosphate oxidase n=1 Tax=Streptomyces sp. MZ04 TaxID=2559236 RepID=UPI00107E8132|nr:pyridoxal 5'-phosphate synthase [Streptomyces sp. MZ04]TGB03157.1 pyridoxal 5'-phosphate synthase [Streptomyces sp. MZ04]
MTEIPEATTAPTSTAGPESQGRALLRTLRVWDTDLPAFDPAAAPAEPLPLFWQWFVEVSHAGQVEPHTMSLATADETGRPDVRTIMLHDADAAGWHFGSHAGSAKGRQLAARPEAALGFYWPAQGRQVRVRGRVTAASPAESRADLARRSPGALASALVGRQSEVLPSYEELVAESEAAWHRAQAEPDAPAPSWTLYVLAPEEVEFFQGDARRRHVRLRYRKETRGGWVRELLWP